MPESVYAGSAGRPSCKVRTTGAERGTEIEPRPSVRSVNASAANPIATARSSCALASGCCPDDAARNPPDRPTRAQA
jgi:hypothetical protein